MTFHRRRFLLGSGVSFVAAIAADSRVPAEQRPLSQTGYVVGEPGVEPIGAAILAKGGNAVDALVATALAGAVTQPHQTGIGGFAAHGIVALDGGTRIAAIDANSMAPAAFTSDIFRPDANGQVADRRNFHGWLAAGVPGVIAGLKLALDQFGTMPFSEVLRPAIELTRKGFAVTPSLAAVFKSRAAVFQKDPGSARLYLPGGKPPIAGQTWRNPDLAEMLTTLAKAESVEPFYRGSVAQQIADQFSKQGGLVTADDMAAYRARVVEPLKMEWGEFTIHTPPLACGGFSVLQMLCILKAMDWEKMPVGIQRVHARIEAMRLAWRDRLTLLGDPEFAQVPQTRLLSADYSSECAEEILAAVREGQVIDHRLETATQNGTLSFSACDGQGNVAALTLSHGEGFGAQITVDGLGLTLGHGMSRFDPRPDHPNAPGPRKHPLHNMVPVIITQKGRPVVAIGGRGGRRIPNAMLEFLTQYVIRGRSFAEAIAAPRLHTEGTRVCFHQPGWPQATTEALAQLGYAMKSGGSATLSAVALANGTWIADMR